RRPTLDLPTPERPTRAMVLFGGAGAADMSVSGFTRAQQPPPTSAKSQAWTEAFLEMLAAERAASPNTLKAYGKDLADADAWLAGRQTDLAAAGAEAIEAYFAAIGARGLSPATAARRRAAVRQFYRFVLGEGWREDDPSRRVDAPKKGRPLPKVLSRDEVERLIAAAREKDGAAALRLSAMIELLYASGLRVSELVGLTLAQA